MDVKQIRKTIFDALPEWTVVPEHTEKMHFYRVHDQCPLMGCERLKKVQCSAPLYPSVTAKLQIIKDPSLRTFELNRMGDYIFQNFKSFTDENIMEHIETSKKQGIIVRDNAGHIGTLVHNCREAYFNEWIKTGQRPKDPLAFIPPLQYDIRAVAGMRALEKFCQETFYVPIVCELLVYSHKSKVAGTLDDIGTMHKVLRKGDSNCRHINDSLFARKMESFVYSEKNIVRCVACPYKAKVQLVLLDFKTSNQFKGHYFLQVGLYYAFLKEIIPHLKIDRALILKVSKEFAEYKIEDLQSPSMMARYGRSLLALDRGLDEIKSRRKDNQKKVIKL